MECNETLGLITSHNGKQHPLNGQFLGQSWKATTLTTKPLPILSHPWALMISQHKLGAYSSI